MNYMIDLLVGMVKDESCRVSIDYKNLDMVIADLESINESVEVKKEFIKKLLSKMIDENINMFSYMSHHEVFSTESKQIGEITNHVDVKDIHTSDGIVKERRCDFLIFKLRASIYTYEYIEMDTSPRYNTMMSIIKKNNVCITYKEFMLIKNKTFINDIKEIIVNVDGNKLLESGYLENVIDVISCYHSLESMTVNSISPIKSYTDYVDVRIEFEYCINTNHVTRRTAVITCNAKEFAKIKLMF